MFQYFHDIRVLMAEIYFARVLVLVLVKEYIAYADHFVFRRYPNSKDICGFLANQQTRIRARAF